MQAKSRVGFYAFCAAAILLALPSTSVTATTGLKPIAGRLSKSGYTVIALTETGRARSVRARDGTFRLVPPAKRVTLHLRARNGTYAGPVVVAGKGRRAIVGVMAGARLGKVNVLKGYGKLSRKLSKKSVDARRWARARRGVPIGAGRFGRVRSRPVRGAVPGDRDLDGIPDPLDIDDDGDLILDNLDRSTAGRGARTVQADGCVPAPVCADVGSVLARDLGATVNVNAGSTPEQINAPSSLQGGWLGIAVPSGDSAELDCGDPDTGLVYCRKNGSTGRVAAGGPGPPFPGCCDPDGDGFGSLTPPSCCPNTFYLTHGARIGQIGTGDVLIERVTTGGVETQFPVTLNYIFFTVPALKSYQDETMSSPQEISYPVGPRDPGSFGFPVTDGPEDADSDVELTLTFWRPQRKSIPGSDPPTAQWMDIGRLAYEAVPSGGAGGAPVCPQSTFSSGVDDPTGEPLSPSSSSLHPGFTDPNDDRQSSPGNTFTYKLNLSQCLAANGISFNSGENRLLSFVARSAAGGFAQQNVTFKRQ